MYGFPIQAYGKLQSAVSLIQRRESTIPTMFYSFYAPIQKLCPQVLPVPPRILFFFLLSQWYAPPGGDGATMGDLGVDFVLWAYYINYTFLSPMSRISNISIIAVLY